MFFFNHLNLLIILHLLPNPHQDGGHLQRCFYAPNVGRSTPNGIKASAGVRNDPQELTLKYGIITSEVNENFQLFYLRIVFSRKK